MWNEKRYTWNIITARKLKQMDLMLVCVKKNTPSYDPKPSINVWGFSGLKMTNILQTIHFTSGGFILTKLDIGRYISKFQNIALFSL